MLVAAWVEMTMVCRTKKDSHKLKAMNPDIYTAQRGQWGCVIARAFRKGRESLLVRGIRRTS